MEVAEEEEEEEEEEREYKNRVARGSVRKAR